MNLFTDALFILIYIFILFCLRMPNIESNNYIKHKVYLFFGIVLFVFILKLIKQIKNKCSVDTNSIIRNSLIYATSGIIGYSIFTDLAHCGWFESYKADIYTLYAIVSFICVSFIFFIQLLSTMFINTLSYCDT